MRTPLIITGLALLWLLLGIMGYWLFREYHDRKQGVYYEVNLSSGSYWLVFASSWYSIDESEDIQDASDTANGFIEENHIENPVVTFITGEKRIYGMRIDSGFSNTEPRGNIRISSKICLTR